MARNKVFPFVFFLFAVWNIVAQSEHQPLSFVVGDCRFDMVYVQGGSFMMGCEWENWHIGKNDEVPVHGVTLSNYYLGRYEVTQQLWTAVMGYNPSNFKGDDLPVEQVSYVEVQEFIRRLDSITGYRFRLPTEAEWEYAARGGRKSRGYFYAGSNDAMKVGWAQVNSGDSTHVVGELVPNELGLYDMTGNVWEWCSDWYQDDYYLWLMAKNKGVPDYVTTRKALEKWVDNNTMWYWEEGSLNETRNPQGADSGEFRVGRGGSWADVDDDVRNSYRNFWVPENRLSNLGFRLALSDNGQISEGWMPNQYVVDSIVDGKVYTSVTTQTVSRLSQGVLEGVFSVSPQKRVRFSSGNLQYNAAADMWRFADRQYDRIGMDNLRYGKNYAGWIDLFAWGTSGYRNRPPYFFSPVSASFGNGAKRNIDGTSYDWGVYNRISNGGNQAGRWRTLSVYEWDYLFTKRPNAWLLRSMGQVGDVQGMVLLPDDWFDRGLDTLDFFTIYTFSPKQWLAMERAGAVFLPAAGMCNLSEYIAALAVATVPDKYSGPIEGFNVGYCTQIPQVHESVSTIPDGRGPGTITLAEREWARKITYAPPIEGDEQLGYYWTTIHYNKQGALGVCFALGRSAYIMPLERLTRCSVRLVQDEE